jgi:hypothetical protein
VSIDPKGRALLVRDPEVLAMFSFEDVLGRILELNNDDPTPPEELARRLFDVTNTQENRVFDDGIHCDSPDNPAHTNVPAAYCPRSEGKLARAPKGSLLDPASEDFFFPVAIVNRLDLMDPATTCGQYRIVYAKKSGLAYEAAVPGAAAREDRAFVILEASVPNPTGFPCPEACRPIAEMWEQLGRETDPNEVAEQLHAFFFDGLPGFQPVLVPGNLGTGGITSAGYYGGNGRIDPGQIRVGEHVGDAWEYREIHLTERNPDKRLGIVPVMVSANPAPSMFGSSSSAFQNDFYNAAWALGEARGAVDLARFGGQPAGFLYNSGESSLGQHALNDYAASASGDLRKVVQIALDPTYFKVDCPEDDPLTVDSILRRATSQSCAGCHAPSQLLGPGRKLGCGLVWPDSLGEVHIDERSRISPALEHVFLPHRARVMERYLAACDEKGMFDGLAETDVNRNDTARRRTLGGSTSH